MTGQAETRTTLEGADNVVNLREYADRRILTMTPQEYSDWESDTMGQPRKPVSERFMAWWNAKRMMARQTKVLETTR